MRMIAPRTGAHEITLAEDQLEYSPLVVALYYDHEQKSALLLSRWTFTPEERAAIAAGEDLYLGVLTHGQPFQPISLAVGPEAFEQRVQEGALEKVHGQS
ncbi:MAG TPA: hypothetical protein VKZ85_14335 [Woeseiaceae bacterium]|nr:hypothetical protein [Woeseiaceae bacterium]